jgi:hypothetical protein
MKSSPGKGQAAQILRFAQEATGCGGLRNQFKALYLPTKDEVAAVFLDTSFWPFAFGCLPTLVMEHFVVQLSRPHQQNFGVVFISMT